jgi:hypothetical protein
MVQTTRTDANGQRAAARTLDSQQRRKLALQAITRQKSITELAAETDVSRKFVRQQSTRAQTAIDAAFAPQQPDEQVLFYLPVTKAWLRQVALGLTLICHSSYRGVTEFVGDLLSVPMSIGTVHNIHHEAMTQAQLYNDTQPLANVRIAALDEIFQHRKPVLVGVDTDSTYCFLLSEEAHRDADSWGIRLLELADRGFAPAATIADFAPGLRAGQDLAMPETPCSGDVFHVLHDLTPVVRFLDNRAYEILATREKMLKKQAKMRSQARRDQCGARSALARKITAATIEESNAIALADDVTVLVNWLHHEVFAVSGLAFAERVNLYDFVVAELRLRESQCPHRLGPVITLLVNHRDEILSFAEQLDRDLALVAEHCGVAVEVVRQVMNVQLMDTRTPERWQCEAALREQLGHDRWQRIVVEVQAVERSVVRSSSIVENVNSRLRSYFFLRRHLGPGYLSLLQFFLNHRRMIRSEHANRVNKSPRELLTGCEHAHWLELLGYQRFSRN